MPLLCAIGGAAAVAACGPVDLTALPARSPSEHVTPEATPPSDYSPLCDEEIPFEPTYLPEGFGDEVFPGPFPGGRPSDDLSSIGSGEGRHDQVIFHYRGSGSRAIEIRRPGTLFTELAQGDDAPTITVLGNETSAFAPISPGENEFIVAFSYPLQGSWRKWQWCATFTLNEYRVSLDELTKVAEGLQLKD